METMSMIQFNFERIWCHHVEQLWIATTCPSVVSITATGSPKEQVFWLLCIMADEEDLLPLSVPKF